MNNSPLTIQIRNLQIDQKQPTYRLFRQKYPNKWRQIQSILKQLINMMDCYNVINCDIDCYKIVNLAMLNRKIDEQQLMDVLEVGSIVDMYKKNPKTKYQMKNGKEMAAIYIANKYKQIKAMRYVKDVKRRLKAVHTLQIVKRL